MILPYDQAAAMKPNGCVIGTLNASMSFTAKRENVNMALQTNDKDDKMEND